MATKKSTPPKKASKKVVKKPAPRTIASNKFRVNLSEKQQQGVMKCIEKSGKATFTLKELVVTRVPKFVTVSVIHD